MGFVILFIAAWIHADGCHLAVLDLQDGVLSLQVNLPEVLLLLVVSLPAILGIANIMLANNICDMDEDMENKRYTLPVYIGLRPSLKLFRILYCLAYLDLVALLLMKVHPVLILLVFVTLVPVYKKRPVHCPSFQREDICDRGAKFRPHESGEDRRAGSSRGMDFTIVLLNRSARFLEAGIACFFFIQ